MVLSREEKVKLEERVKAQKAADEVVKLMVGEATGNEEFYWECLHKAVLQKMKPQKFAVNSTPMTDVEATVFGRTPMPFGKYSTVLIREVPLNYLDWLIRSKEEDTFENQLRRYMQSDLISNKARDQMPVED